MRVAGGISASAGAPATVTSSGSGGVVPIAIHDRRVGPRSGHLAERDRANRECKEAPGASTRPDYALDCRARRVPGRTRERGTQLVGASSAVIRGRRHSGASPSANPVGRTEGKLLRRTLLTAFTTGV